MRLCWSICRRVATRAVEQLGVIGEGHHVPSSVQAQCEIDVLRCSREAFVETPDLEEGCTATSEGSSDGVQHPNVHRVKPAVDRMGAGCRVPPARRVLQIDDESPPDEIGGLKRFVERRDPVGSNPVIGVTEQEHGGRRVPRPDVACVGR